MRVLAEGCWPESEHDDTPPALPGFIVSSFSPIAAEAAARCLSRREADAPVTAVLMATSHGDRRSADHVARTVAEGGLLGPLLFFQSVPNAVAGHIAARWNLTGPVVCLADAASAREAAALLIEDGDADEALVIEVEQHADGKTEARAALFGAAGPITAAQAAAAQPIAAAQAAAAQAITTAQTAAAQPIAAAQAAVPQPTAAAQSTTPHPTAQGARP